MRLIKSIRKRWRRLMGRAPKATLQEHGFYVDRYGQNCDVLSVDYRKNEAAILSGEVPEKYGTLVPIIPGERILEIGAGEGVFSLALSSQKAHVIALDITPQRHEQGKLIQARWRELGRDVNRCELVLGDIFENAHLLNDVDTIVACRVIYYFQEKLNPFMDLISRRVRYVCLIGNEGRNRLLARGAPSPDLGEHAYYSTLEGMRSLLERFGYEIIYTRRDGDPVVIGARLQESHAADA